ncbi:hypothetical protein JK359_32055 [Streptomyces actinomycinicus]|uniref:Uncharacterized protein n=1 Tax=Streptomyces actinomycinicus TaxID=1695166 RepID=A0A937ER78_9ACTN|nr:hypothetical protein [Streptomyces actinomycinicus]MBL1086539.1 hypothetical protein [Streptomyces actinomycinicus]
MTAAPSAPAALTVLARAESRTTDRPAPPPVHGFAFSAFAPLVAAAVTRCLTAYPGGAAGVAGPATAVLLVTTFGDTETADAVTRALSERQPPSPVLFFQSVPTSVLGHLTRVLGVTGPMACLSVLDDAAGQGEAYARVLLASGAAERALVVEVELAAGERDTLIRTRLPQLGAPPEEGRAVATLLTVQSEEP